MNGFYKPGPRFSDHTEPISPQSLGSPPWSAPSQNLDQRLLKSIGLPQPSDWSAALFHQLPPAVIDRILWAVDANGFASLCLLNRTWYRKSQSLELYAYHLSRCPSYALANNVITGPFRKNDLYRLKAKFAAEVRRNLFDAYLRPRETLIRLVSVSANSSAAFPGGEAFRFEFSPNGRTILAISSSRIYVLDATEDTIEVRRELKTVRRPLSASVTDDGSLLAVLSSKYQANIYALNPGHPVRHLQVIVLDNPPRTIALAHEGTVLAASWSGGIEVFSLAANALSTDRRAVRSEAVDSLMFSGDGSMLFGSSHDLEEPNAVVITAPFYTENDPNITPREIHSRMWTTQILFPQISSTVSHVALLPGHTEGDANWLFAFDHTLMSYRAVRTDDTRTGVAYFLSPPTEDRFEFPQPCVAPIATGCGTLAAAGFAEYGLWIYGVPERLDVSPDMGSVVDRNEEQLHSRVALTSATGHPEPLMAYSPSVSGSSEMIDMEEDGLAGKVDWRQSLFVKCKSIPSIKGFTSAKWVENSDENPCAFNGKRLIVTAPAGLGSIADDLGEEDVPIDGSRICLLDFEYSPSRSANRQFTIEVGDNEPEVLSEQLGNLEVEVAMERRRTVRATRGRNGAVSSQIPLGRSHTAASPPNPSHLSEVLRGNVTLQPSSPSEELLSPVTRSSGLARSATAAGFQHARFPPRPPLGTAYADSSASGRRLPHSASVDSWETPPPPYGIDGLAIPSTGARPHTSSHPFSRSESSHSTLLNGNLAQLGTFGQRNQLSQPTATMYQQPRSVQFARQGTSMDGMMTSESGPSGQPFMSQYSGMARSPRPENIPEEAVQFYGNHRLPQHSHAPPKLSATGDPDSDFSGRQPQTHAGQSPDRPPVLRPTLTHPISPPTPDRPQWLPEQQLIPVPPSISCGENRLSLTGANLQNRLNHPVPPIPPSQSPATTYNPPQAQLHPIQRSTYSNLAIPPSQSNYAMGPNTPTTEQMARLSRWESPMSGRVIVEPPSHQRHHSRTSPDFGAVSPSPSRAAWVAPGMPGSPSFNRAHATPNRLSRNDSRGSNPSIGASRSTPNLVLSVNHSPRPIYQRIDMINSAKSAVIPLEHERSHSVIGNEHVMQYGQEGRRILTDPNISMDKKSKKKGKKVDGERSGRRCIVM